MKLLQRQVDDIDLQICEALKNNAKLSYKTLSQTISLCQSSIYERVKRLEDNGVILGYNTDIDWSKFEYAIHAFILLKEEKRLDSTPDCLKTRDEVFNCWTIAGEYDYMVEVYVRDNHELGHFMDYLYHNIGRTYTLLVMDDMFKFCK